MKLSCALVLALTNLVIATPYGFSVKGSGSPSKVHPASGTFGTFGLAQTEVSKTGYSGSFSKSSSASFASSSASESSGSFSYNAAQGTPSVAYNTGAAFGAPGQIVDQNVAVTPQNFATAVPVSHNTGSSQITGVSDYSLSKDVSDIPVHVNTPSKVENKPDFHLGSNPHAFVSQDISRPNILSTGSIQESGVSSSFSSQYASSVPVNVNTATNLPAGQQPGIYVGSTSYLSGSQGNAKTNTFGSGSPVYTKVPESSSSQGHYGGQVHAVPTTQYQQQIVTTEQKPVNLQTSVSQDGSKPNIFVSSVASKQPEKHQEFSTVHGFSNSAVNSGSVSSSIQGQVSPTVEEKPVYSSGFGGPPGILSPYDKASVSGVPASNAYQQTAQLSESVHSTSQDVSYTHLNNPKPSHGFQQQQAVTLKPFESFSSGASYFPSNAESSYKPEVKPSYQNQNKPVLVNTYEKPSSEWKPPKEVQAPVDKDFYQKPEVQTPHKPEVGVDHSSQTVKPGYQISIQTYPAQENLQTGVQYNKDHEKVEPTKKPLYTGGFGAPAGVLEPIRPTHSQVNQFASSSVKPDQIEQPNPTVGYTTTVTKVNEYSSISGEVKPTEKPYFENSNYQSFVGSSPASYVTLKPTGSISYTEKDSGTSSFDVSSTSGTVGAIGQKGEEQLLSKPYNTVQIKPTLSTWEQNSPQASTYFVQKPGNAELVKPAGQVSSQVFTTSQPPSYSYQLEEKNPTSPIPGGYTPSTISVTIDKTKPNYQLVSTGHYESSQPGVIADKDEIKKPSYQTYPTGSTFVSSTAASSYKPEQNFVPLDKTEPSGPVVVSSQKEITTVSDVKVSSDLSEKVNEKETIPSSFVAAKPNVPQNSAINSNTHTGFVSVQQPTKKPSFEGSSDKYPAFALSGNPLTITHEHKPSFSYVEQKQPQKPNTEVINKETSSKGSVLASDNTEAQFSKKPTVTNQNKPFYSSSYGTLTGSTGYKPSSYGQESTFVTGSNEKVSQFNYATTVKPFGKPGLSTVSQQTVSTSSVSQNTEKQKQSDSTFVKNKPSVVQSQSQQFTTSSAVASGATVFSSKPQYQLPTIQPVAQNYPWNSNSFGTFGTAKPYNNYNPGFTSSFTTYGQDSSQEKTKQTTQINSNGQYIPYSTGQYKPYTTGQYKPHTHNWGFNGHPSYQRYPNVYPTGSTFVSTYAPTTFKPFVTSSPFEKSKTSSIFSVTGNKESTYVSGFGSPLSITTAKPSLTQTSYKPNQEPSVLYSEKPSTSKYETPISKPSETHTTKPSHFTQNSGPLVSSSIGQSSFSTVKPTVYSPTSSGQFEITSATIKPSTQSPSKVSELSYTSAPVSEVNPSIQNKPYSGVEAGSFVVKPTSAASHIKVDEKIQSSQTVKPYWSSNLNQKESSIHGGVTPNGVRPTEQVFLGTTSYSLNKEVTPTQVSSIKPSSFGDFTVNTLSSSKGDEKIQYTQTPKPNWSASSNQKEPSPTVSVGGPSESLKPTGQTFFATSSQSFNEEVTPTQVSAIKPTSFGTFNVDTSSQKKPDEKVQFSQTSKPVWSSVSYQKVPSESLKPSGQPFIGTSLYSVNKVVAPTQVDSNKPLSSGISSTGLTTGTTNVDSVQSVLSSASQDNSAVHLSSVEKWSSTPTVTPKPEYSSSFGQSSGYAVNSSPSPNVQSDSATVSGAEHGSKPISATGNSQYVFTSSKPAYPKPTVEKKPAFGVSYNEKDTNQASFAGTFSKPTVPSEYSTEVKVSSKYTDGPAKVPTTFIHSTQVPYKPTVSDTQTSQQTLGLNSNIGASQPTQASYVGGFGGPPGILKPNDFNSPPQQQYVQTQYKPSYNNQVPWVNQQNPPSGHNSNTASHFGGYGAPSGVWTANENVKPTGFGYVQSVNKYTTNVQTQKNVNQQAVVDPQTSVGTQSIAAVNPATGGFVSNHHQIQNPFNGGASTGTGFNNDYKLTGQVSGSKAFGTAQSAAGTSSAYQQTVVDPQTSVGTQSNAAVNPATGGFVSNHHHIQNPFNGGAITGTGFNNDYKLTGQVSGTKAFGTAQSAAGTSSAYHSFGNFPFPLSALG